MREKEKVVFKRYNLHLKGREYKVLIPAVHPKEVYVTPETIWWDKPLLDGNHVMYKLLRSVSVEMIRDPELIVYVPSRKNEALDIDIEDKHLNYDVVFYCHNSQLNRHKWEKLKEMFPYTRAERHTSVYSVDRYKDYCGKKVSTYQKSRDYYNKKSGWRIYECPSTFFSEGSRPLYCESFLKICEFTEGCNLEEEVRNEGFSPICFAFGFEMGYLTMAIVKYWDTHKVGPFRK